MPRANSGGRSSGRRSSSTGRAGKSFSGRAKSSNPYKKSEKSPDKDGKSSFGKKSFSRDDKDPGKFSKPYGKRDSDSSGSPRGGFSKRSETGNNRPSRKEGPKKFSKPYGKRDSDSSESTRGGFSKRSETGSDRPFRKESPKKFSKPYVKRDDDASSTRGGFSKRSETGSDRPFRKEGPKKFGKPYGKRDSESSNSSRGSFSKRSDSGTERPYRKEGGAFARPYKKFDRPDKKDEGEGSRKSFDASSAAPRRPTGSLPFRKDTDSTTKKTSENKREFTPRKSDVKKDGPLKSEGREKRVRKPVIKKEFSEDPKDFKSKSTSQRSDESQAGKIRLNRFIANSGICSRREADELIKMGLVAVNGKIISELGYKVNLTDEVRYENRVLRAEKPVYILLNKPKGFITTTDDPQERNTVMQIIGGAVKERIYPVGRLDRNTTGLLLLTNDGDLADKLMHPSYNVKKIYKVELDRPINKADFQKILDGVHLEEGKAMVDDLAIVSDDGKTVGVELHIGWNRVVRRIFESLNYDVVRLDRSVYAGLDKKDLSRGHWRFLTKEEVVHLKHFK